TVDHATPRRRAALWAVAVLALSLGAWHQAGRWYHAQRFGDERDRVRAELAPYGNALATAISHRFALLEGLAAFAGAHPDPSAFRDRFATYAAGLVLGNRDIRAIQVFPAAGPVLVYPVAGNEATVGRTLADLVNDERAEVRADVARALRTGQIALSGPYELRQGGLGLVARLAVGRDETPLGLAAVVLDLPPLLHEAGLDAAHGGLELALRDDEGRIFRGPPGVFGADPVVYPLPLPEGAWQLAATPARGWASVVGDSTRWFRALGLAVVGLLTALAYALGYDQARLRRAVRERTAQLTESEARYRELFEGNSDALFVLDAEGRFLGANRVACEQYGYSREELLAMTTADLSAPELRDQAPGRVREALEANTPFPWRHRRRDGTELPVEIGARPITLGGRPCALASVRDATARVAAEAALRQGEERLRLALQAAAQGLYDLNVQTGEAVVNDEYARMLGYDPATFVETNARWIERLHPDDAGPVAAAYRDYVAGNTPEYRVEFRQRTAAGDWKWILSLGKVVERDAEGRPLRMLGTHTDISERKRAEGALRESEARFRVLFEHAPVGVAQLETATGRFLLVNRRYGEIVGLTPEEMAATTFMAITHPDDVATDHRNLARLVAGEIPSFAVQKRYLRPDGSTVWAHLTVSPLWQPGEPPNAHIAIVEDITERRRAEEALRYQEVLLRQMGRIAKIGGWEFDPATGKGTWTEEVARIHDLDPGDGISAEKGMGFYEGESRSKIEQAVREAIELGKPYDLELELVTAKGAHKWVHTIGNPTLEKGRVVRVRGSFQDITERKRAEGEIRRLNETLERRVADRTRELAAANQELEAFAYSVSHDLRAPLRAIDGFTRILAEDYAERLDAEGKRVCGVVRANARRMGQLIDDLLAFSRLGRAALQAAPVDMGALARSVYDELASPEQRERVELRTAPLPGARGDRALLRQVWVNLLGNALKFSSGRERPAVEVGGEEREDEVVYWVRDNGAGFEMQYADKLFGVFQRLHRQNEFEGTGVGLAIVQRIVERHGGRVWAEGEVDRGATFWFALPRGGGREPPGAPGPIRSAVPAAT
ncbi:MAG: PAS domain S-box protein, partial [Deferrisomatales bacterium]